MIVKYIYKCAPWEHRGVVKDTRHESIDIALGDLDNERESVLSMLKVQHPIAENPPAELELRKYHVGRVSTFSDKPGIMHNRVVFDRKLSKDEALAAVREMYQSHESAQAELESQLAAYRAAEEAEEAARKAKWEQKEREREAEKERRARELAERKEAAKTIPVGGICDLYARLVLLSGEDFDHRFNNWIKRIESVDESKSDGFMYQGDWLEEGDFEYTPENHDGLYLLCATSGSRRNHNRYFRLAVIENYHIDVLPFEEAGTVDTKPGWALRMLDDVKSLLAELNDEPLPYADLRELIERADKSGADEVYVDIRTLKRLFADATR